jgi:GNAT superfamily N-acetyltransferase
MGPGYIAVAACGGSGDGSGCGAPYIRCVTTNEIMLAAYDEQMRGAPPHPPVGVRYEQDGPVLRIVGQFRGFISAPRDVGVRGADLDQLIARQRDYFAARGEAVEWKTRAHDEPADLTGRLRAAGFVPEEQETVLIGLTRDMATEPVVPDGIAIRQVTSDHDLRRIAAMESVVWEQDWSWLGDDLIARVGAAPDQIAVLVAEAAGDGNDGQVVSAAWLVYRPGSEFAGLWGGSTLREWRGRGIYRALVATRANLAAARGVRYLHVDASDDSAPILRRLGFRAVTTTTPYVWTPPAS